MQQLEANGDQLIAALISIHPNLLFEMALKLKTPVVIPKYLYDFYAFSSVALRSAFNSGDQFSCSAVKV